jgi:hypothetical protein
MFAKRTAQPGRSELNAGILEAEPPSAEDGRHRPRRIPLAAGDPGRRNLVKCGDVQHSESDLRSTHVLFHARTAFRPGNRHDVVALRQQFRRPILFLTLVEARLVMSDKCADRVRQSVAPGSYF